MIAGKKCFLNVALIPGQADRNQTESEKGEQQIVGQRICQEDAAFFLKHKFYQKQQEKQLWAIAQSLD